MLYIADCDYAQHSLATGVLHQVTIKLRENL